MNIRKAAVAIAIASAAILSTAPAATAAPAPPSPKDVSLGIAGVDASGPWIAWGLCHVHLLVPSDWYGLRPNSGCWVF